MPERAKALKRETVFKGRAFAISVDEIIEPGGVKATREVVEHGASVVILARANRGGLLLVRQFRYPAKESLWELVAGGIEPGESLAVAAARELAEETGYSAQSFKPLFSFYPSPGYTTEEMHLVEATRLTSGLARPEPDEKIETRIFTLLELKKMMRGGKIKDGKTLIGLLWFLNHRE